MILRKFAGAAPRVTKHACLLLLTFTMLQAPANAASMTVLAPDPQAVTVAAPGASAGAYAVYDTLTERFIADGNGSAVLPMASTTKIMTALVALENLELDDTVTFSREMTAIGSSMYLSYGEKVSVRDLLYGLMLMSGNDAARALASLAEGGEAGFVALMNKKAAALSLANTSFKNPNGLDDNGHHTTARELAQLTAHAMKNPTFREIVSTKSGTFAGRAMTNHNKLLTRVEDCVGVKTGYTTKAGRCLVSATHSGGRDIIVVTLSASNDWHDHSVLHSWAAKSYPVTTLVSQDRPAATLTVVGGTTETVELFAQHDITLGLSADESSRVEVAFYAPSFVYAPLRQGDVVGGITVSLDGKVLATTPLIAAGGSLRQDIVDADTRGKINDFLETLAWSFGICYNARR